MYRLKKGQESFTMTEGPLGMKTYNQGEVYEQIPAGMEDKFESSNIAGVQGEAIETELPLEKEEVN